MQTGSGGYLLVLSDRRSAWAGVRVRFSRFRGDLWLARARRLIGYRRRIPLALKLLSAHYVDDPDHVQAQLAEALGPRFAQSARVRHTRLRKSLRAVLADDKARLESRFDTQTGLFRTPGDALPIAAKRLVARLAGAIVARTPEKRRTLSHQLRRPYALGLLWPMLTDRLEAEKLPALYCPEIYRALVRSLAGCHLTDAEMIQVLSAVSEQPAEYRLGASEYARFARRQADGALPGLDRFAFFLLVPRDHMIRGIADYRRRVHGALPVRLAIWTFRVLQIAALGVAAAAVAWLILRVEGGLMPGLTLFFAAGASILAGRLYRRPDMARFMGHVSEKDLEAARAGLERVHTYTLEPVRGDPRAETLATVPRPAAVMPVPHGAERGMPQPVDIPAPIPVPLPAAPASVAAKQTRSRVRPAPVPLYAGVTNAYISTPLGPIPFPVPRGPVEDRPTADSPEETLRAATPGEGNTDAGSSTEDGAFILGWGMPIPVPNWMAATLPESPPVGDRPPVPDSAEASPPSKGATNARVIHAPPLPPVLPSPAFWGIEGAGLPAGADARPGAGDGSRRRDS